MGNCFSGDGTASAAPAKGGSGGVGSMFGFPTNFEQLYDTGKELGRGTFGTTYVCTKKGVSAEERAKHTYAVKVILKSSLQGEGDIDDVKREVKIMELLKNKSHVVLLEGAFEDKTSIKMILELCAGGELFERIISKKHYSEKDASTIVRQMLEVVGACHVNGIIHRDLKPENFLFATQDEDSALKVTDFGLSTGMASASPRSWARPTTSPRRSSRGVTDRLATSGPSASSCTLCCAAAPPSSAGPSPPSSTTS